MSALKPVFLPDIPSLDEKSSDGKPTSEELALNSLSKTRGWKVFKDIAGQVVADLNNINKQAISQGMSLEEIGRNAVVASLAQGVIERLMNKVTDSVEAVEAVDEQ